MKVLPFTVSPSVSDIVLHREEAGDSWAEFVAWYAPERKYEIVRFTFERLIGVRMGGMSGEAGAVGIGEVVPSRSQWLKEIDANQLKFYPQLPDNFKSVRHYYIRGHDEALEFLCEDFKWQTIRELPGW